MRYFSMLILGLSLVAASTALFPSSAFAAKLELRNRTPFKSATLELVRDEFKALVADSEQATYEKETALSRGAKFAFEIIAQKPGEKIVQVLKQALHKARPNTTGVSVTVTPI